MPLPALQNIPVVLLPVRLETFYGVGGTELWVRIYPDDIHVDTFEPGLTAEEREAGTDFVAAGANLAAWRTLVRRFGAERAAWVRQALTLGPDPGSRPAPWNRAPHTQALPDQWVVLGYRAGQLLFTQWSNPVPPDLPVGPTPPRPGTAPPPTVVDAGMAWMTSFTDAEAHGMAVRVRLPTTGANVDQLVVLGVKGDAAASKQQLQALLERHRFTRGLGFLPEGTPTNGSAAGPTGFSSRPDEDESWLLESTHQLAGATARAPGKLAARALGLDAALFSHAGHAGTGEDLDQRRRDMNAALWPATGGYFLEQLMQASLTPALKRAARAWFVDWVRAAGDLPTLRVGNQPYGLLAVTPVERWPAPPPAGDVAATVADFVRAARQFWDEASANVPRVGVPGTVQDGKTLLNALSLQPRALTYRLRNTLGPAYVGAMWRFLRQQLDPTWESASANLGGQALARVGRAWNPTLRRAVHSLDHFPWSGPLVQQGGNPESLAALEPNYLQWLAGRPGYRRVRDDLINASLPLATPRPLLYLLARHSLLLAYVAAATRIGGVPVPDGELVDIDPEAYETEGRPWSPWDLLDVPYGGGRLGQYLDGANEQEVLEVRDSLGRLSTASPALLEQLMAETLDLCSHRLDAWTTSLATSRLDALRNHTSDLYVGGYGFVENLRPGATQASEGYVQGPSIGHAATAGLLASAYVAHENSPGRLAYAVDLSSARVRLALSLLDGVRQGQPLGALLGYGFERGLQQRQAAQAIDPLRTFAPLSPHKLTPREEPTESVAPSSVVDAFILHRRWVDAGRPPSTWPAGWPAVGEREAAVLEELQVIDEAVDALSDVLLAETMYGVVQGNGARVAATLDAMAGGTPPPVPQVVRTPRTGIGVVHRVVALLPATGSPPVGTIGQEAPREVLAHAEPALSAWASTLLGSLGAVCRGEYLDVNTDAVLAPLPPFTLADVVPALSPLDLVYAAGSAPPAAGSVLEQRVRYHALRVRPAAVPANAGVRLVTGRLPGEPPDTVTLDALADTARAVHDLFTRSRALDPADLAVPAAPLQPLVDDADLAERARVARDRLAAAAGKLTSSTTTPDALRAGLFTAAAFGVPGAVPQAVGGTADDTAALRAQAAPVLAEMNRRLAEERAVPADPASPQSRRDQAVARLRALFGPSFRFLSRFRLAAPAGGDPANLVDLAFADRPQGADAAAVATWFQRVAHVRDGMRRASDALLAADLLTGADRLTFQVGQLPRQAQDRWVALPFPSPGAPPTGRIGVVALQPAGPTPAAGHVAGLLVDEWAEVVPNPTETTGVAFHYDAPGSTPPHAVLIGVPPPAGWSLDALAATVRQTLEMARARAVDRDALAQGRPEAAAPPSGVGQFLPALYLALNLKGMTVATDFRNGVGRGIA